MNIGWISEALPYLPSRGGFRLYGGNLIRHLSQRHRIDLVSLLTTDDNDHLEWSRDYCASIRTIQTTRRALPARMANALSTYLWGRSLYHGAEMNSIVQNGISEKRWDVLHVEGTYVAGLLDPNLPIAKVLSLHDSWTLRCSEMLKCSQSFGEWAHYKCLTYQEPRYERLVYPRFERCTAVAQPDVDEVRVTVADARVDLIPYGTDTDYFHPLPVTKERATVVFHSHLGYAPNIEAALEFANDIFPLVRQQIPEATLHLVGADPGPKIMDLAGRPGIRISANLPDLRAAVCAGRVYVSAIRHGTGLKSKILEAMAMRLPVVCYPGSAVGIACENGRHLLVAQNPQDFAAKVVGLLQDEEESERIAGAGRALVEQQYSWESRARMYEELYEQVIHERWAKYQPRPGRSVVTRMAVNN